MKPIAPPIAAVEQLEPRRLLSVVSVSDAAASEGDGIIVFHVSLDIASPKAITLHYSTSSLTAKAGKDFRSTSHTLRLLAGETSADISVKVIDDHVYEGVESFALKYKARGAFFSTMPAIGTITENDPPPIIQIADHRIRNGASHYSLAVRLSAASELPVTVQYSTLDGSVQYPSGDNAAKSGQEYTAASGTITLKPGRKLQVIRLSILPPHYGYFEPQFRVQFSNAVNATLVSGMDTSTLTLAAPNLDFCSAPFGFC